MDTRSIEIAKQRFDFDAWRGRTTAAREIRLRQVLLPKDLVRGMDLLKLREIDPGDGTRLLRAAWHSGETAITVDVRECENIEQAHEIVVEILANFQAPDMQRHSEPIGDVSFGRENQRIIVFARGNLAVTISNGGKEAIPVTDFARSIDSWIVKLAE